LLCCILAGCDYLKNPTGIGLKTAYTLLENHKTIPNVIAALQAKENGCIPHDYESRFEKAYLAFKFQRVWCPIKKEQVYLNELPFMNENEVLEGKNLNTDMHLFVDMSKVSYEKRLLMNHSLVGIVGQLDSKTIASLLSQGKLNPNTKNEFEPSEYCCSRKGCISKSKSTFMEESQNIIVHQGSSIAPSFKSSLFSHFNVRKEQSENSLKKRKPEIILEYEEKKELIVEVSQPSKQASLLTRAITSLFRPAGALSLLTSNFINK
jgi:5'-3' exonuclease